MSFWRTFGFHTISPVENILDRENFTLEELLDEEDVLQETKAQNKKLIDYFVKPETLLKFIFYLTQEPEENADTKRKFKYPYVCCEILCSEVWSICEAFFEQDRFAAELLAFFDREQRLNPLLANYVCKVCSSLLSKKSSELLTLMRKKDDLIGKLMRHLNTSPVMDLLLKIIVTAEDSSVENNQQVLLWLRDSNLIPRLIEHFQPQLDPEIHENVATALIEIIVAFSQLEAESNVKPLLEFATAEGTSPYGLTVVIELLNRHIATQFAADVAAVEALPPILRTVCGHVPRLIQVLRTPPNKRFLLSTGELVPLGFYRLKVAEFFAALVRTNYRAVNDTLMRTGVFETVLELFFQYEWNDFLHSVVEQLLVAIFQGADSLLKGYLVSQCKLPHRIIQVSKECEAEFAKPGGVKKGYMAFVPHVADAIVIEGQKNGELQVLLNAVEGWELYVNTLLAETKALETNPLAGVKPPPVEHDSGDDMMGSELVLKYLVQQGFSRDVQGAGGGSIGGGSGDDEEDGGGGGGGGAPHHFIDSFDDAPAPPESAGSETAAGNAHQDSQSDEVVLRHGFGSDRIDDVSPFGRSSSQQQQHESPFGDYHYGGGGGGTEEEEDDPTFVRRNIGHTEAPPPRPEKPLVETHADATPPLHSADLHTPENPLLATNVSDVHLQPQQPHQLAPTPMDVPPSTEPPPPPSHASTSSTQPPQQQQQPSAVPPSTKGSELASDTPPTTPMQT